MRIAILTSGVLPIPAVQGGAVENLIDMYLEYNERRHLHEVTVFSVWHPNVEQCATLGSSANKYVFVKGNSLKAKLWKVTGRLLRHKGFYHDSIEYYLHEALRQIRKGNYGLIIVENRPGYAFTLSRQCSAPCILHLHNDFLYNGADRAEIICQEFQRIICVSDFITNRVKEVCKNKEKCITVHNAIDTGLFYSATPIRRSEIGLTDDDFVLVFSGRLIPEKGILQLIQAMNRLRHIPRLKLLIIGASDYGKEQSPTPFTQKLQQEAKELEGSIVFTGFIVYEDVPSYLKAADVAVMPSIWEEPFGLTIIEAMAAGLPLITTRSGGIPEICEGIATLVNRENIVNNLTEAITDLYKHPQKREKMARTLLERSKLYDKNAYAQNFFDVL